MGAGHSGCQHGGRRLLMGGPQARRAEGHGRGGLHRSLRRYPVPRKMHSPNTLEHTHGVHDGNSRVLAAREAEKEEGRKVKRQENKLQHVHGQIQSGSC